MKLEKLFQAKDGKLFDMQGKPVDTVCANFISWSKIESDDEVYNEEYLASLRDELKLLEDDKKFVFLDVVCDRFSLSNQNYELFTACMKHTARRLKDCISIVGFSIPDKLLALGATAICFYVEELSAKHKQYVYFVHKSFYENCSEEIKTVLSQIEIVLIEN